MHKRRTHYLRSVKLSVMVGSRTVNATINRNSEFGRRSGAEGFMQSVASKAIGLR